MINYICKLGLLNLILRRLAEDEHQENKESKQKFKPATILSWGTESSSRAQPLNHAQRAFGIDSWIIFT